jgi:hypothetical protein
MSSHIQKLGVAVVFLAAAAATPTSAIEGGKPSFWVENDSIEIGKVIAGRTASATFVFRNDGENDVHIVRATPS